MPDEFDWEDQIYEEHERLRRSEEELREHNQHLLDNMSAEEKRTHREEFEKELDRTIDDAQGAEFKRRFREKHFSGRGAKLIIDGVETFVDGWQSIKKFHININYNDPDRWIHLTLQWSTKHPSEAWMEKLEWIPKCRYNDKSRVSEITKGLIGKSFWNLSEALAAAIALGSKPYFRPDDKPVEYTLTPYPD